MNTNFISIVLILIIAFTCFSCSKEDKKVDQAEWQGKIEYEAGVKVVKNPDEPVYGEIFFDLEEDLSIGKEDDENYVLFRVRGIQIDGNGNIFVLDRGNYRIQKFDREGKHLQTVGKKGQGPGEFEAPLSFSLDSKNNLYIYDNRKIKIFNHRGEFLRSFPVSTFIRDFAADFAGKIMANATVYEGGAADRIAKLVIIKINSGGKIDKKIAEFSDFGPRIIITPTATRTLSSNHEYRPRLLFAPLDDKVFVYAFSTEYQIIKIDDNGNILSKFQNEEQPQPISRKEKEYIIQKTEEDALRAGMEVSKKVIEEVCHFRKYRTYFNSILADDKGRIYIRRVKSVLDKRPEINFDIFSKDGYLLYKTKLPFTPESIHNGYLYDIHISKETGDTKIKRYKVKNWKQIKEYSSIRKSNNPVDPSLKPLYTLSKHLFVQRRNT